MILFGIKLYVGLASGSISIYSDGINNFFDCLSGALAFGTIIALGRIGHEEGEKSVFIMIDDLFERKDSSEFMGWIYDADFEFLNTPEMKQVILAGPRCYDYKLRLLIAGLPEEKILCEEDEFKAVALIDKNVSNFYLLHDTSTYDLACEVEEKIIADFKAFNENGGKQ